MTTSTVSRPASATDVIALQYANPTRLVVMPLGILVTVVIVMTGVTVAVTRSGGSAADLDSSGAVVWSLLGFVVATGVQAVTAAFPLALALGATRRTFTAGVLGTAVLQAALLAVASLVLLGLELASSGWFVGARVLRDGLLGGGDPGRLVAVMSVATLTAMIVGGLFGAASVRFGARGPAVLGVGIAALLVAVLLVLPPDLAALGRAFQPWWPAVVAAIVVVLATAGEHVLLRRAGVR